MIKLKQAQERAMMLEASMLKFNSSPAGRNIVIVIINVIIIFISSSFPSYYLRMFIFLFLPPKAKLYAKRR